MKKNFIKISFHDNDFSYSILKSVEILSEMFYKDNSENELKDALTFLIAAHHYASNTLDKRKVIDVGEYIKEFLRVEYSDKQFIADHYDVQIVFDINLATIYQISY